MMLLPSLLAALLTLTHFVSTSTSTSLRITTGNHSFGGVNYPQLQFSTPAHRDASILEIVRSGARVIRLFIRPDAQHADPEGELGGFDRSLLDQFDDTLAAIHHLSKGQVKVIIAPHDAHALRGSNDIPCDAYCEKLNGAFLDFYSVEEYRNLYKTRLEVFFKHYPSKNFDGRPWSELSEVILGVDLQNQPFSGISPIPAGESWLCDIASHLKFTIGLDTSNIAVISGGVSGPQSVDGDENFPDSVFECKAIDVIGIHGYFDKKEDRTAGTPWAELFLPGNTLMGRAAGRKKGEGKLLLVEEWGYVHNDAFGLFYKKEAVWDQGNVLNYRGIPWLYSHLTTLTEERTSRINPLHPTYTTWPALVSVLKTSLTSRAQSNWTTYLPPPTVIIPATADENTEAYLRSMLTGSTTTTREWRLKHAGLSNVSSVRLNPYIIEQSECTFGCEGHLCDAADGCAPDLLCKNSICQRNAEGQPGKVGDRCNSKAVCQAHLRCEGGKCTACEARRTIQPEEKRRRRIQGVREEEEEAQRRKTMVRPNDANGRCYTDSLAHLFETTSTSTSSSTSDLPICLPPTHHPSPCTNPTHCSAHEYCSWGSCTPCLATDACLGSPCRSNAVCKTGFCNDYGRCDYVAKKKKKNRGPGGARGKVNARLAGVPRGHERGPAKVRDEAMRIRIPGEKVVETGGPGAAATA